MECPNPNCTAEPGHEVVLLPLCHRAPVVASYKPGSGVVRLECAECNRLVASIAVLDATDA